MRAKSSVVFNLEPKVTHGPAGTQAVTGSYAEGRRSSGELNRTDLRKF